MCQICGKIRHIALKCHNRFNCNYQSPDGAQSAQEFSSLQVADPSGRDWYPDSGASAHITNDAANLQRTDPYHGNDTVMVADGTFLPISHVGSANFPSTTGNITLNEVLVCPDIQKFLLSVSKLCEDYPCGVYFHKSKVCVIDIPT